MWPTFEMLGEKVNDSPTLVTWVALFAYLSQNAAVNNDVTDYVLYWTVLNFNVFNYTYQRRVQLVAEASRLASATS